MKLKKKRTLIMCSLLTLTVLFFVAVSGIKDVSAEATKTVRIGYMDYPSFIEQREDGSYTGYGAEYLTEIARYTEFSYEYVYGQWSDLLVQLKEGKIDFLCTAQKTLEREKNYDYSAYPIGYSQGLLYAKEGNDKFCYEDYDTFDGCTIGMLDGTAMEQIFDRYADQHDFIYQKATYESESELVDALNAQEIDLMCTEHLANRSHVALVAKFGADAYYIMSYKNSPYIDDVNFALQEIKSDVDFEANLFHKYYDTSSAETTLQFTQAEQEYIKQSQTISIGLSPFRAPFSSYDEKTDTFTGVNVDILDILQEQTGLRFEYVPLDMSITPTENLSNQMVDIACGVEKNNFSTNEKIEATNSFLESAIVPVGRTGEELDINGKVTVALPTSFQALKNTLMENYPNMKMLFRDSNVECLDAVLDYKADIFIQNTHLLSIYLQEPKYEGLDIMPLQIMTEHTAMAMLKTQDPMLLSIINKGISNLDEATIDSILIKHTFANPYHYTFKDFVYKFRLQIIIIAVLVIICFLLMFAFVVIKQYAEKNLEKKNKQLGEAIQQAQQANSAKSEFLARMSHEIRTPMNAIVGLTEIAKYHEEDPKQIDEYLTKIDASSKVLLNIINDVLDMSAIESNKIKIAAVPFDLKELLNGLSTMYYSQCKNKGIQFDLVASDVTEEILIGDSLRVNQILLNLLSNAFKFTPQGGSIKLEVTQTMVRDHQVYMKFVVSDTGSGMAPDMIERLFKPFEQEDVTVAKKHGGSGLGLSIAKNLVEMMHGHIDVQSTKGEGTTFTVDLSFEADDKENHIHPCDFKKLKALIVDDDNDTCQYTAEILHRLGVNFEIAHSGEQAIEMLTDRFNQHESYDVCFIDWLMPGMDGIDVTRKIRAMYDENTIIIIVSAYDLSELEDEAKNAGANLFVSKPIFQSTVFNLLMSMTGGQFVNDTAVKQEYDFTGKHLLLAEDKELNMEIAVELLEMVGFTVDWAEDGNKALTMMADSEKDQYDAILMDIQMPVMDGYEATREIRKLSHPRAKTIPIYAMTANAFTDDVNTALSFGMNGHIAKPIDTMVLYRTLDQAMKEEKQ